MVDGFRMIASALGIVSALFFAASPALSEDATQASLICDKAAIVASHEFGVPLDLLRAIALTETATNREGRHHPWPWTVNMEGEGHWFASRKDAYEFTKKHRRSGATSFDVGCFQINYRWHSAAFSSLEAMFDPTENARYAAKFLTSLKEELGDWTTAVGAYHSRTPKYAKKYIARFQRIRTSLDALSIDIAAVVTSQRRSGSPGQENLNSFPLLQPASTVFGQASLVPLTDIASAGRFISIEGQ